MSYTRLASPPHLACTASNFSTAPGKSVKCLIIIVVVVFVVIIVMILLYIVMHGLKLLHSTRKICQRKLSTLNPKSAKENESKGKNTPV
jgi:flagellar basal body-associated protein FliL